MIRLQHKNWSGKLVKYSGAAFPALLMLAALGVLAAVVPIFGNRGLIVRSGSMEPAVGVGDLVIVRSKTAGYKEGDIIAFRSNGKKGVVVTHRIVSAERADEGIVFTTKGDANNQPDTNKVKPEYIIGRQIFTVPYLGKLLAFGKTKSGYASFILVPGLLVIASELMVIVREITRDRRQQALRVCYQVTHPKCRSGDRIRRFVPVDSATRRLVINFARNAMVVAVLAVMLPSTFAFYSDSEISAGNTFAAGTWSSPALPANHVVISEVQIAGTGSTTKDFVELYNPTDSAIDMNGWKLVKKISNGSSDDVNTINEKTIIPAHGFWLWANNSLSALDPDEKTTAILSDDNSVRLQMPDGTPVDSVAWGSGTNQYVEGSAFPANPEANQSIERKAKADSDAASMSSGADVSKGNGFDSGDNSFDFILRSVSNPQNSATGGTESL